MAAKPWKDLTEAEKEDQRQKRKRRKYLRDTGRSPEVPAGPVTDHVRRLHDEGGMTFRQISRATGEDPIHPGTIADLHRGRRPGNRSHEIIKNTRRATAERLLAVPVPAEVADTSLAVVPSHGVRRRLQALACAGFGAKAVADLMSRDHKQVWRDMTGGAKWDAAHTGNCVTASTRKQYVEFYDKMVCTDPWDFSLGTTAIKRAKEMAARYGWAPEHCWDDDTIDDPDAFPEWTGECGTVRGYFLHLKHEIAVRHSSGGRTKQGKVKREVLCQPCRSARTAASVSPSWVDEDGIRESVAAGRVYRDIAKEYECSTMTVQRIVNRMKEEGWEPNKSGPRPRKESS